MKRARPRAGKDCRPACSRCFRPITARFATTILFSEGVVKGRIDLNRFVALTSTNHAKTYGLYPRKGSIAVGSDADIAIWNPKKKVKLTHALLKDGSDYTPYEGLEITGWPELTMVRGRCIVNDGRLVGSKDLGQFIKREVRA
jgi:dihydropyrimidinase